MDADEYLRYPDQYRRLDRGPEQGPPGFEARHQAAVQEGLPVRTEPFVQESVTRTAPFMTSLAEHAPEIAATMVGGPVGSMAGRVGAMGIRTGLQTLGRAGLSTRLPGTGMSTWFPIATEMGGKLIGGAAAPTIEAGTSLGIQGAGGALGGLVRGEDPEQAAGQAIETAAPWQIAGQMARVPLRMGAGLLRKMGVLPPAGEPTIPFTGGLSARTKAERAPHAFEMGERETIRGARAEMDAEHAKALNERIETYKQNQRRFEKAMKESEAKEKTMWEERATNAAMDRARGETYLAATNIFKAPITDIHSMHQYMVRDAGRKLARDDFMAAMGDVAERQPTIQMETMTEKGPQVVPMSTRTALEKLTEVGGTRKVGKYGAPEKSYRELRDEIRTQLPPEVRSTFDQAQAQMAQRMGLRHVAELNPSIFKPGGITEAPAFDPEALRKALFNPKTVKEVERRIGEDNYEALMKAVGGSRP